MADDRDAFSSLWLLAAEHDEALLQGIIDELSERHRTPRFRPHLTLLGDIGQPPDRLLAAAQSIARAAPPFAMTVQAVASGDAYYRSFYALFGGDPALLSLRAAAETRFGPAGATFMPHVSLLYGRVEEGKAASVAATERRLGGRPIHFDRLALTNSADDVPIERWETRAIFHLGHGTS